MRVLDSMGMVIQLCISMGRKCNLRICNVDLCNYFHAFISPPSETIVAQQKHTTSTHFIVR
jgi:hypothetical protein